MRLLVSLLLGLLFSTSVADEDEVRIRFAAMGDVPYRSEERIKLATDLLKLPADTAFVVHVGDIKPGTPFCGEGEYSSIAQILKGSPVPVFVLPGDNEWNDCGRPQRAWGFWMKHLHGFERQWPRFQNVVRQSEQPANFTFVRDGVLFLGLHIVGGRVHDAAEWTARHHQNLTWLQQHLLSPQDSSAVRAAVIFGHSQPSEATAQFFRSFSDVAKMFDRPVLYLHGDGHRWVKNRPFKAKNLLRVQVDLGGKAPPVIVSVKRDVNDPFDFDRRS